MRNKMDQARPLAKHDSFALRHRDAADDICASSIALSCEYLRTRADVGVSGSAHGDIIYMQVIEAN